MPFKTELKSIYENHIKALGQKLDITVVRANEIFTTKPFINKVWDGIFGADLIIADCTEKNANVFYEIGLAHVIAKPVAIVRLKLAFGAKSKGIVGNQAEQIRKCGAHRNCCLIPTLPDIEV